MAKLEIETSEIYITHIPDDLYEQYKNEEISKEDLLCELDEIWNCNADCSIEIIKVVE